MISLALTFDKTVSTFENMLQGAGFVHREPGAHQEKQRHQKQKHQKFHGHGVGDGGLGVLGMNMESLQQSRDRAGKEVVQDFGKPELFRHEVRFWLLAPSFYSWLLLDRGPEATNSCGIQARGQKPVARSRL